MNRKGFTLIELIVTIALLAVVAVISFVSISGVVKKGKISDCESLHKNIKSAAAEYISDRRYSNDLIINEGKVSITASDLISGKYLSSPIIDPFTNQSVVASNINVIITLNKDYTSKSVEINVIGNNALNNCSE